MTCARPRDPFSQRPREWGPHPSGTYVAALGLAAGIYCISVRLVIALMNSELANGSWVPARLPFYIVRCIAIGIYTSTLDIATIAIVVAIFSVLLSLQRRAHRIGFLILYHVVVVAICGFAVVNIEALTYFGAPFTFQWLYISDFLGSTNGRLAVLSWVPTYIAFALPLSLLAMLLAGIFISMALELSLRRYGVKRSIVGGIALLGAAYGTAILIAVPRIDGDQYRFTNAAFAFAASLFGHPSASALAAAGHGETVDFEIVSDRGLSETMYPSSMPHVRNVIVYVMESVAAKYLDVYGATYGATPEIAKLAQHAILFQNIYAQAPSSNVSLVSLLTSTYPWLSYEVLTKEHPTASVTSMSSMLKAHGFRTAFFHSSDTRYLGADTFLSGRGFDVVSDFRDRKCDSKILVDRSQPYSEATTDSCTSESLLRWIQSNPVQPFFAVLWTFQTHYPYFRAGVDAEGGDYSKSEFFNRYLAALHETDMTLGAIANGLQRIGAADSTLLVVLGDHGEAFGQHGNYGHGADLYEESIHIPLMLANPKLAGPMRSATIGGLVDIAPTIMHVLSLPEDREWQGRSLLAEERPRRTYFFSAWKDYRFGIREGHLKYIYNAGTGKQEIFDLLSDLGETNNLASALPGPASEMRKRVSTWLSYQDEMIARWTSGTKNR